MNINVYTTELYSAIKNKISSFAEKWMEPEGMELEDLSGETGQIQKDKYPMFSLICGS